MAKEGLCLASRFAGSCPRWVKMRTAAAKTGLPVCLRFRTWTNNPDQRERGSDLAGEEQIEGKTKSVPSSQSDRTRTLGSPNLQHILVEVVATLAAPESWRRGNHVGTNFDPARRGRGCWDDSLVGNLRRTARQYRAR